ncbi:uncharacterized protein [Euphorbia lathyris]|uniref:uncharacterized protein n=1 Tax=Euphorbia lathyris TaxID=212925 RepID=UPI0033144EDF
MPYAVKLLNPIRHSLSSITYFYSSLQTSRRQPFYGKLELIRTWLKQLHPKILTRCPNMCKWNLDSVLDVQFSGSTLTLLGVSCIIGYASLSQQVTYAMDGQDDDPNIFGYSNEGKDTPVFWLFVRKLWLPAFFFLTVVVNWHHPVMLVTKLVLFLVSTKPSPLSVYVFIEQLCHQSMRQKPYLYSLKSLYANKVEVQDYKLFCLATVEVKDHKLTLVGVLGGWWALPLSQRAFSVFRDSAFY